MTKVTRKGKAATSSRGSGSKAAAPQVTAAHLFQQAQIALRFDDFDAAKDALRRAVRLEPNNGALVDAYACLLAELGEDSAQEALLQLEDDPSKALQYSSQGLALLQSRLDAAVAGSNTIESRALSKALSKALCGHAEMVLGHASMLREEAAATATAAAATAHAGGSTGSCPPDPRGLPLDAGMVGQIEVALRRAAELQPESAEPGQALASLRSEQGRSEEALAALKSSMAFWWDEDAESSDEEEGEGGPGGRMQEDGGEAGTSQGGAMAMDAEDATPAGRGGQAGGQGGEDEEEEEEEEEDDVPSFEFRFECAKLLLELDDSTDTAVAVLHTLVEEHDSNPDAWHLLALALYSGHQYDEALEVAVKGQDLLRRLRVPKKDDAWAMFSELMDAIKEAAGLAAAAAGAAGIKPGFG